MRELRNKKARPGKAFDSRQKYYSRLDLICIDEFLILNSTEDNEDTKINVVILHEFINAIYKSKKAHLVISIQCDPFKMESLIMPISIGESIKGRLLQGALIVHMGGQDLRQYDPENEKLN